MPSFVLRSLTDGVDDAGGFAHVCMPRNIMTTFLNVGRMDRILRVVLGGGLCVAGIFINGHHYLSWALGIAGVSVILSGTCGT
jgi:hypothetical protein